jgi:CBS domain-containing protein
MEKALVRLARKPAVSVPKDASVLDAIYVMLEQRVGAALVLEDGRAIGMFTERDVMVKVVAAGRDAATTRLVDVMTSPVLTIHANADIPEALEVMVDRHIRHLPVVDDEKRVIGMLSMRYLMTDRIDRLQDEARSLENYIGTEGIAGG